MYEICTKYSKVLIKCEQPVVFHVLVDTIKTPPAHSSPHSLLGSSHVCMYRCLRANILAHAGDATTRKRKRTAQNSHAVTHVEYASLEMIRATIDALRSDLPPAAVKLGMMGTDAMVSTIGAFLDDYEGKVVCDPVMISTR